MRKLLLAASLMAASSFASAKITYVTGELATIDFAHNTISIVDKKSHKARTFAFNKQAMEKNVYGKGSKAASFKTGQMVTLKLKDSH